MRSNACWARSTRDSCWCAALPGAGKTRFLHRASEIGARMRKDIAMYYAALRSRDDGPYAPVSRLLLDRFGILPASSPTAVRADMEASVSESLAASPQVTETTHLLGHVVGVPFRDSVLLRELERDPAALHGQAMAAVTRFVAGDARKRPLLWLFDDVSNADPNAWELIDALLELAVPLAIVIAAPPDGAESIALVAQCAVRRQARATAAVRSRCRRAGARVAAGLGRLACRVARAR